MSGAPNASPALIVVNGPIASGKSSVALCLAGLYERAGCSTAVIDLDVVWHMVDHHQPRSHELEKWLIARHAAAAVTDVFFSSGIKVVIAEGPFLGSEERDAYTRWLRTLVTPRFVTLTVAFDEARRRGGNDPNRDHQNPPDPAWLARQYARGQDLMPSLELTDLIVQTDGKSAEDVAAEIVAHLAL